jgi:hypothetical protein
LGVINGGLGLQLADNASSGEKAAYIVIVLIMLSIYIGTWIWFTRRTQAQVAIAKVKAEEEKANQQVDMREILNRPEDLI